VAGHQDLYQTLEQRYFGDTMQEREELARLGDLLDGVRYFADIGAGLGQYALHADALMTDARIHAVEADPVRHARLAELASVSTRSNRITVVHAAVADLAGQLAFHRTEADKSGGLFPYQQDESFEWEQVTVPAFTLDALFAADPPDLIKIDIEGSELRALHGARRILEQRKVRLLVEVHPWGDPTLPAQPSDVFLFMARNGYGFTRVGRLWLFAPSRPSRLLIRARTVGFVANRPQLRRLARHSLALLRRSPSTLSTGLARRRPNRPSAPVPRP
jgi:FkbM family methyltransferase